MLKVMLSCALSLKDIEILAKDLLGTLFCSGLNIVFLGSTLQVFRDLRDFELVPKPNLRHY